MSSTPAAAAVYVAEAAGERGGVTAVVAQQKAKMDGGQRGGGEAAPDFKGRGGIFCGFSSRFSSREGKAEGGGGKE